jgi:hypothetical protein
MKNIKPMTRNHIPTQYLVFIIKTSPTVKQTRKVIANTAIVNHRITINKTLLFDIFVNLSFKFENATNTIYFI